MKEQFVTYEIAKKLKEVGFDEPCFANYIIRYNNLKEKKEIITLVGCGATYFDFDGLSSNLNPDNKSRFCVAAPLWQQAMDWLEAKNLHIHDYYLADKEMYGADLYKNADGLIWSCILAPDEGCVKNTRREAWEQAIIKAIEILKTKSNV